METISDESHIGTKSIWTEILAPRQASGPIHNDLHSEDCAGIHTENRQGLVFLVNGKAAQETWPAEIYRSIQIVKDRPFILLEIEGIFGRGVGLFDCHRLRHGSKSEAKS